MTPDFTIFVFATWPFWLQYLIRGILISLLIVSAAVAATRAGRSPYWALLMVIPYVSVMVLWALAFTSWPNDPAKDSQ